MTSTVVPADDGTLLSVRRTGRASGPLVLLCDGIGCDGYVWRYLRPDLERTCRVVHFHYRGHGASEAPANAATLTIPQCARDAWQVVDAVGGAGEPAVLFGHSMGVQVLLEAANQQRDRVRGLVAVCGAFERPLDTFQGSDFVSRAFPVITGAAFKYQDGLRRVWQRAMPTELAYRFAVATEINAKMIRREDFLPYLRHMSRLDPLVFLTLLNAAAQHSARPYLAELHCPALVVAGSRDNFTPRRLQVELAALLPDAELCEVPGGSHTAPLELPDLIALRLESWSRRKGLGLWAGRAG